MTRHKEIKRNPYSENLARALQAVSELSNPDYLLAPVAPTPDMKEAGAAVLNITPEQAERVYVEMIAVWANAHLSLWEPSRR